MIFFFWGNKSLQSVSHALENFVFPLPWSMRQNCGAFFLRHEFQENFPSLTHWNIYTDTSTLSLFYSISKGSDHLSDDWERRQLRKRKGWYLQSHDGGEVGEWAASSSLESQQTSQCSDQNPTWFRINTSASLSDHRENSLEIPLWSYNPIFLFSIHKLSFNLGIKSIEKARCS